MQRNRQQWLHTQFTVLQLHTQITYLQITNYILAITHAKMCVNAVDRAWDTVGKLP